MVALLPAILLLSSVAGLALWVGYALPGVAAATGGVLDLCQSFFVRCLEYIELARIFFLWFGIAVIASGFAYASFRAALNLFKARGAISNLPVRRRTGSIILIDDKGSFAFTQGLFFPKIYISKGLLEGLDRDEAKAVFFHELHHRRNYDPLRFFLLSFIKDAFFYLPALRHAVAQIRLKKEHEADDAASSAKGSLALSSALVKVARFNHRMTFQAHASIHGGLSVTGRIKRLIEGTEARFPMPPFKATALSASIAFVLALSLAWPIGAAVGPKQCTTKHCKTHIDKLGKDCRAHCDDTVQGMHGNHGHH